MQENSKLKEIISKYLEKRKKSEPTRLDSIFRAYVKGELQTFCEKYPFISGIYANLPDNNVFAQAEINNNTHKNNVKHEKDKTFLTIYFEKSSYYGEIIFFDDAFEYHILKDNIPDEEYKAHSSEYDSETNPFKSVIEEVWNEVSIAVKEEENAKNELLKKKQSKYKRLYFICYALACLIAVAVILLNRSGNNSVSLWYLAIAIVPIVLGSFFKYKTLDKK